MILLDTNVLSEVLRPTPSSRVRAWMAAQPAASLFTTAITEAEMLYGVASMASGRRRRSLADAIAAIFREDFAGRVLPFDSAAAAAFAEISAARRKSGRPISAFDAQIAAIARSRGADIATRDVTDFEGCAVAVINPWASS